MAFETGIAAGHRDLLNKLRLFLTTNPALVSAGQAWIAQKWINGATTQELILRAPGTSGDDSINVGFYSYQDTGVGYYNWAVTGFTGFVFTSTFMNQPGANTTYGPDPQDLPSLNLTSGSIDYTFTADGRHVRVTAKIGSRYYQAYAGFALPFANPLELPYPFVTMAARSAGRLPHADVVSCRYFDAIRNGAWEHAKAFPLDGTKLAPNPDGSLIMMPVYLYSDDGKYFGQLEGINYVPGAGVVSEDIIEVNLVGHVILQDAGNTGDTDYLSFRLS